MRRGGEDQSELEEILFTRKQSKAEGKKNRDKMLAG